MVFTADPLGKSEKRIEHAFTMHGEWFATAEHHIRAHQRNAYAIKVLRGEASGTPFHAGYWLDAVMLVAHEHKEGDY